MEFRLAPDRREKNRTMSKGKEKQGRTGWNKPREPVIFMGFPFFTFPACAAYGNSLLGCQENASPVPTERSVSPLAIASSAGQIWFLEAVLESFYALVRASLRSFLAVFFLLS